MNQLIILLREGEQRDADSRSIREIPLDRNSVETSINVNSQNLFAKSLIKLCSDKSAESSQSHGGKLK